MISVYKRGLAFQCGADLNSCIGFMFTAPVAVRYSFRTRRPAPDRLAALAAFRGALIITGFLVFVLAEVLISLLSNP